MLRRALTPLAKLIPHSAGIQNTPLNQQQCIHEFAGFSSSASALLFLHAFRGITADNYRSRYFCSCLIRQLALGPLVSSWHSWRRRRVSQSVPHLAHSWYARAYRARARVCSPIRRHARPSAGTRCEFHYARLCGIMHEGPRCNSESLFAERRRRCIVTQSRSNDQEMRVEYALAKCPSNHGIPVCV